MLSEPGSVETSSATLEVIRNVTRVYMSMDTRISLLTTITLELTRSVGKRCELQTKTVSLQRMGAAVDIFRNKR